jgi:hypothetical protein
MALSLRFLWGFKVLNEELIIIIALRTYCFIIASLISVILNLCFLNVSNFTTLEWIVLRRNVWFLCALRKRLTSWAIHARWYTLYLSRHFSICSCSFSVKIMILVAKGLHSLAWWLVISCTHSFFLIVFFVTRWECEGLSARHLGRFLLNMRFLLFPRIWSIVNTGLLALSVELWILNLRGSLALLVWDVWSDPWNCFLERNVLLSCGLTFGVYNDMVWIKSSKHTRHAWVSHLWVLIEFAGFLRKSSHKLLIMNSWLQEYFW